MLQSIFSKIRQPLKAEIALVLSSFLLAVSALFVGQLMERFDGFFISWFNFAVGLAVSSLYMVLRKKPFWLRDPKSVLWRCFYGGIALVCYYLAVQYSSGSRAALMNLLNPFFIVLAGPLFFGESFDGKLVAGLVLCLAGVRIVFGDVGGISLAGEFFGILSAVTAALALLYLKRARSRDGSVPIYFWICAAGFQCTIFSVPQAARLDIGSFFLLVLTGLLVFAAQVLLNYGIRFVSASQAGLYSFAKIIFTIFLGAIFSEMVLKNHLLGLLFILAGLLFLGRYGWVPVLWSKMSGLLKALSQRILVRIRRS